MGARRDAATAVAELALYLEKRAAAAPHLVGTMGMLNVPGGSMNVVPGRCQFSLDIRATTNEVRDACAADVRAELARICDARGLSFTLEETLRAPAAPSAAGLATALGTCGASPRPAAVPHAQRRRPRRDEAARGDAAGDAVRARRKRRHQPQPAGIDHQRRCATVRRCLPAPPRIHSPKKCHEHTLRAARRLDRRALRRTTEVPAGTGARAHRHAAGQQRAARRAHRRVAQGLRLRGREASRPAVAH